MTEEKQADFFSADFEEDDGVEDYRTIIVDQSEADIENETYPYTSIKVVRDQYSIFEMKRKYDRDKLCLDPSFQRNFVWGGKQKSELIESVIMGIPLPLMYLAENRDGQMIVVDGRQRLTTFIMYLNNDFPLRNLKILSELNGETFKDLETDYPKYASMIEDYQLVTQVIKYPAPDRIRFDIFDRVNRGGTPLNKQEMRNALYQGQSTQLLLELTESEEFLLATGHGISNVHMKDRYIALRAISFSMVLEHRLLDEKGKPIEYRSDIDDLTGKVMDAMNQMPMEEITNIRNEFLTVMHRIYTTLGENAFRIPRTNGKKSPISMTLFETMYYLFHLIGDNDIDEEKIRSSCQLLLEDEEYLQALQIYVDGVKSVRLRFSKVQQVYEGLKYA